jgi:hypothetical protein
MKDKKDPRKWTNQEIESDSKGYIAAQRAYREEQEKTRRQAIYAADEASFTREFVAAGGERTKAAQAFRDHRNRQAAHSAEEADAAAEQASRRRVRSTL